MSLKSAKSKIVKVALSSGITKGIWYTIRRLTSSRKSVINSQNREPRLITWGSATKISEKSLPKIIWTYWSGAKSPCAKACQKSWKDNTSKFIVNELDKNSVKEYIPDFPEVPPGVPIQLITDLIRLTLLERFGGMWMDYTVLLTQPVDWVTDTLKSNECEALAFYNEHPSHYRRDLQRPIIENGLIAARPQSMFITRWRELFEECILSGRYLTYFREKSHYDSLVSNFLMHDQNLIDYLACYVAAQSVMLESDNYRLALINSEDEYYHYFYATGSHERRRKFAEELLLHKPPDPPISRLIKINGRLRNSIDEHITHGCYRADSLLGQYLSIR